jgi:hypothetical protein
MFLRDAQATLFHEIRASLIILLLVLRRSCRNWYKKTEERDALKITKTIIKTNKKLSFLVIYKSNSLFQRKVMP